jgi:hypothetical protein
MTAADAAAANTSAATATSAIDFVLTVNLHVEVVDALFIPAACVRAVCVA